MESKLAHARLATEQAENELKLAREKQAAGLKSLKINLPSSFPPKTTEKGIDMKKEEQKVLIEEIPVHDLEVIYTPHNISMHYNHSNNPDNHHEYLYSFL